MRVESCLRRQGHRKQDSSYRRMSKVEVGNNPALYIIIIDRSRELGLRMSTA